jgi:hypothetical protein
MINEIRLLLAAAFFCLGLYLVYDLFANGFSWAVLVFTVACFVLAHYVKPDRDAGDGSVLIDIVDLIIDIPFKAIAICLRAISRPFKGGGVDGIDF